MLEQTFPTSIDQNSLASLLAFEELVHFRVRRDNLGSLQAWIMKHWPKFFSQKSLNIYCRVQLFNPPRSVLNKTVPMKVRVIVTV